jgi:Fe-S-cluster containining protein
MLESASTAPAFRFACHRCGHCCSGGTGAVWLEEGEEERLAAALGIALERFVALHVRELRDPASGVVRRALREQDPAGGRCALLSGANTCRAYEARPAHCRAFPFWPGVLAGGERFESARATCPGIAVEVEEPLRSRAFAELEALYERLEEDAAVQTGAGCCLERDADREALFATGLEADYALARRPPTKETSEGCRLARGRPLGCRLARRGAGRESSDAWQAELRAIERRLGYPAAYGRLAALLDAREIGEQSPVRGGAIS